MKEKLLLENPTLNPLEHIKWLNVLFVFLLLLVGPDALAHSDNLVKPEPNVKTLSDIEGGTLNEDNFNFCVDGEADHVSGVSVEGAKGPNMAWIVTDEDGTILGLPPAPEAVNFDDAGPGICLIWHISYADGLQGLEPGNNALTDLYGAEYDLSDDNVRVYRNQPDGGELAGGPFEFVVDGIPDMVTGISQIGKCVGSINTFVITDDKGKILGLPKTLEDVEAVNFDEAGAGTCLIWNLRYESGLIGLRADLNANDLIGCYDLSNPITVVRKEPIMVDGGTLNEDDFVFCVDGEADRVSGVSVEGAKGPNMAWVVTDADGLILGLPPRPEAVNFDEAGPGLCLIWHISFADGLEGLTPGNNALTDLVGTYDLSDDNVRVYRNQPEAGELTGGPYEFTVDGKVDNVSGIELIGEASGANSTFVITDDQGKILGLPPTLEAVEGVDFDAAGVGTCLIWYLRYEDGLQGLEADLNANDLYGCFDLSNPIEVVRNEEVSASGRSSIATIYPLPATDVLNVSLESFGTSDVQVTMVSLSGTVIKNSMKKIVNKEVSVDIQSLPPGLYIINLTNQEGRAYTQKVMIQ